MPILIQRFTTSEWKFQFWNNTVLLFLSVFFAYGKDDFFRISFVSVAIATLQCPTHEWLPIRQIKLTQLTFCYNEVFSTSQEFFCKMLSDMGPLQDGLNKASMLS